MKERERDDIGRLGKKKEISTKLEIGIYIQRKEKERVERERGNGDVGVVTVIRTSADIADCFPPHGNGAWPCGSLSAPSACFFSKVIFPYLRVECVYVFFPLIRSRYCALERCSSRTIRLSLLLMLYKLESKTTLKQVRRERIHIYKEIELKL